MPSSDSVFHAPDLPARLYEVTVLLRDVEIEPDLFVPAFKELDELKPSVDYGVDIVIVD